ncbi:MAG TPA: response regulator [Vicinamibacterales bacterium]|nr:response regulator [Vicinamibacterales bacterium]
MVLIVDDNPDDRALFAAALEPLNVRVVEAASAEQALAMHEAQQWAVIVVDANLPGLSGSDLIKRLRTPAVLLSAMDEQELRRQAADCGADWMQKRGDINAMRTTVARLLR